jgi:hypothetical protein
VNIDTAGMSLSLIFDSTFAAELARRQIRFTDVSITSVGLLDLRGALDRHVCPEIGPLVEGTLGPLKPGESGPSSVSSGPHVPVDLANYLTKPPAPPA